MLAPRPQGCSVLSLAAMLMGGSVLGCRQVRLIRLIVASIVPCYWLQSLRLPATIIYHPRVISSHYSAQYCLQSNHFSLQLVQIFNISTFNLKMCCLKLGGGLLTTGERNGEQSIPLILLINALFPHAQIIFLWIPDWIVMWCLVASGDNVDEGLYVFLSIITLLQRCLNLLNPSNPSKHQNI